ncbi:hypothetical protein [Halomonas sp. MA07-2]|uniref:hypothetical protein n=1 Tax=Halomonas sp. MA07-2 TaxID=3440841 RepID=UPI003F4925B2
MSTSDIPLPPSYEVLQQHLQTLVKNHVREREYLAELLSQLLEENDRLKRRIRELEAVKSEAKETEVQASSKPPWSPRAVAPERALGLNFSLPKR